MKNWNKSQWFIFIANEEESIDRQNTLFIYCCNRIALGEINFSVSVQLWLWAHELRFMARRQCLFKFYLNLFDEIPELLPLPITEHLNQFAFSIFVEEIPSNDVMIDAIVHLRSCSLILPWATICCFIIITTWHITHTVSHSVCSRKLSCAHSWLIRKRQNNKGNTKKNSSK